MLRSPRPSLCVKPRSPRTPLGPQAKRLLKRARMVRAAEEAAQLRTIAATPGPRLARAPGRLFERRRPGAPRLPWMVPAVAAELQVIEDADDAIAAGDDADADALLEYLGMFAARRFEKPLAALHAHFVTDVAYGGARRWRRRWRTCRSRSGGRPTRTGRPRSSRRRGPRTRAA